MTKVSINDLLQALEMFATTSVASGNPYLTELLFGVGKEIKLGRPSKNVACTISSVEVLRACKRTRLVISTKQRDADILKTGWSPLDYRPKTAISLGGEYQGMSPDKKAACDNKNSAYLQAYRMFDNGPLSQKPEHGGQLGNQMQAEC